MQFKDLARIASVVAILSMGGGAAWWSSAQAGSPSNKTDVASRRWAVVRVELPAGNEAFPPGVGADIAASQCLICHSAGMVLQQPPLTKAEWRAEIVKMRSAFGAPVPDDQVDALSGYLTGINGRQ
jgi:mono/diheme cytochrome c family protein